MPKLPPHHAYVWRVISALKNNYYRELPKEYEAGGKALPYCMNFIDRAYVANVPIGDCAFVLANKIGKRAWEIGEKDVNTKD